MKKLLLVLTAIAVSLAFVGMAVAKGPIGCPPPCKTKMVVDYTTPDRVKPVPVPKPGPVAPPKCITDKCGNSITVPGGCYTTWKYPKIVRVPKMVDVYTDLCAGKAKGSCMPCGFCVPVKWDCKWKTSVICGKVEVLAPKKIWVTKPVPVRCVTEPCPPPDCCF
jgi:hypothetical protein